MHAFVMAGGIPQPEHSLYPLTKGGAKALLDMGGEPMIGRVLAGLRQAQQIERLIVIGLDDPHIQQQLAGYEIDAFLPNHGSLVANGFAGLAWVRENDPDARVVLGCSSDIPHLHGPMVDDLIDCCRPFDRLFYYPVVRREQLEAVYPQARRTYTKFKGGVHVAGADLFVMQTAFYDTDRSFWEKITGARKYPLQVARIIGWWTLIKLAFRQLAIEEAAAIGGRILGADRPLGIVFTPYPELAMDADKPHQVEILRKKFI